MVELDLSVQFAVQETTEENQQTVLDAEVSSWSPDELGSVVVAALLSGYEVFC
jgi:hypothetical protein